MPHGLRWARQLIRELLDGGPDRLLSRRSYADPTFLELFFEWLDDRIFDDPKAALPWAKVTPELTLKVPRASDPLGRAEHHSRLVQAWARLGGAYRAAGQPDEAEAPYREACKLIESQSISALVRADTNRRLSTLRACQGRLAEALELVTNAVNELRKIEGAPLGDALVAMGYVSLKLSRESSGTDRRRRLTKAVDAFGEALDLVGKPESPAEERVHDTATKNLAIALSESGSLADQRTALLYIRRAHRSLRGRVRCPERYRLFWVEALIWSRLGSHARAEKLLRRALEGFEALQLPWEIALVGLDLAALLHLCGEVVELEEIALKTFERFRVLSGADTQTLAALQLWVDAVKARAWETVDVDPEDPGKALRGYESKHGAARQAILAGVATGRCRKMKRYQT